MSDGTLKLSGKSVELYNWANGKADIEQMVLDFLSEKTGIDPEYLVLISKVLGIDEAVEYGKTAIFTIAGRLELCAEYTIASSWVYFMENSKECLEQVENDIVMVIEDSAQKLLSGEWAEER